MGITFDEAITLQSFVPKSWIDIITFNSSTANNHSLNTLLIKLFFLSKNESLFFARLPNVFAFAFYLFFAYKICHKHLASFVGIICFLTLILNPFILDFFSIARGYGLGLGFQMASLYFLFTYIKEEKIRACFYALLLAGFSVLSNFSMLNYWIALFLVINILPLSSRFNISLKQSIKNSLFVLVPLVVILYSPLKVLITSKTLYYGGHNNFHNDTLYSLSKYTLYSQEYIHTADVILDIFLILLFLSFVISIYYYRKLFSIRNITLLVLLLSAFSIILQFYLFGTPYLTDRTALFFIPLLMFSLFLSVNDFKKKWYGKSLLCIFSFCMILNFSIHMNLHKTIIWYFNSRTTTILHSLNEIGKKENRKIKIDCSWPFGLPMEYYLDKGIYPFVENARYNNHKKDYYLYLDQEIDKVYYDLNESKAKFSGFDYKIFKHFEDEFIYVYQIGDPIKK